MGGALVGPVTPGSMAVHVGATIALILVVFTGTWAASLVTVAHEMGHVVVATFSGRNPSGFMINEDRGGGMTTYQGGWGVSRIFVSFAGYPMPSVLGLAGSYLVLAGKSWSVLWAAFFLLLAAFLFARTLFTTIVVVLAGAGIGWAAIWGSADIKGLVAVTLVWWLLLGSLRSLANLGWGADESDAGNLARFTWIPAFVWVLIFWFIALYCLLRGGSRLLGV